jgi:Spherulation-specific family 4
MRVDNWWGLCLTATLAASCGGSGQQPAPEAGTGGTVGRTDAGGFDISVDGAHPQPGSVRMAVPAYFVPGPEWQRIIAGAPTVGMIVFNPNSGPGTATDSGYTAVIGQAQAAGITVLGYVATSYGQRAEADILADINHYYDYYTPSGIYLAEGPMDTDCAAMEAMYHRLSDAARARDPRAYLAVGTRYCPTYIFFFDLMVQFARNWTEYQTDYAPPSWMPANSAERFCHFVNNVPEADASRAISLAITNGAGWVFVTDGADPNAWGALPSYFDRELATLRGQ